MALRMNEAQRQATTGLIEQSRQQQVIGILADRSFGQRSAGIQASREERDLHITQAQRNTSTTIHRPADIGEHAVTGISRLGGDSLPLLPAAPSAMRIITSAGRGAADISVKNATQLSLDANQINLSGALKAAEIMRSSGMKAVRLDQMSQIVGTLSRDLARRTELAMTLRY
jgi:hypothetical protein